VDYKLTVLGEGERDYLVVNHMKTKTDTATKCYKKAEGSTWDKEGGKTTVQGDAERNKTLSLGPLRRGSPKLK